MAAAPVPAPVLLNLPPDVLAFAGQGAGQVNYLANNAVPLAPSLEGIPKRLVRFSDPVFGALYYMSENETNGWLGLPPVHVATSAISVFMSAVANYLEESADPDYVRYYALAAGSVQDPSQAIIGMVMAFVALGIQAMGKKITDDNLIGGSQRLKTIFETQGVNLDPDDAYDLVADHEIIVQQMNELHTNKLAARKVIFLLALGARPGTKLGVTIKDQILMTCSDSDMMYIHHTAKLAEAGTNGIFSIPEVVSEVPRFLTEWHRATRGLMLPVEYAAVMDPGVFSALRPKSYPNLYIASYYQMLISKGENPKTTRLRKADVTTNVARPLMYEAAKLSMEGTGGYNQRTVNILHQVGGITSAAALKTLAEARKNARL